jgi:hypothetical protein
MNDLSEIVPGVHSYGAIICWLLRGLESLTVSSTNKTKRHDITEILLKVALNHITLIPDYCLYF